MKRGKSLLCEHMQPVGVRCILGRGRIRHRFQSEIACRWWLSGELEENIWVFFFFCEAGTGVKYGKQYWMEMENSERWVQTQMFCTGLEDWTQHVHACQSVHALRNYYFCHVQAMTQTQTRAVWQKKQVLLKVPGKGTQVHRQTTSPVTGREVKPEKQSNKQRYKITGWERISKGKTWSRS